MIINSKISFDIEKKVCYEVDAQILHGSVLVGTAVPGGQACTHYANLSFNLASCHQRCTLFQRSEAKSLPPQITISGDCVLFTRREHAGNLPLSFFFFTTTNVR